MTSSMLAAQATAGPDVLAYLKARGIDRTATLALIAASAEDAFIRGRDDPQGQGRRGRHRPGHPAAHVYGGQTTVAGSRRPAHAVPAHAGYHHDYLHNVEFSRREAAKTLHGMGPVRGEL